jgi:hypothetical protein
MWRQDTFHNWSKPIINTSKEKESYSNNKRTYSRSEREKPHNYLQNWRNNSVASSNKDAFFAALPNFLDSSTLSIRSCASLTDADYRFRLSNIQTERQQIALALHGPTETIQISV